MKVEILVHVTSNQGNTVSQVEEMEENLERSGDPGGKHDAGNAMVTCLQNLVCI